MIDVNELLEEAIRETENLNDGEVFNQLLGVSLNTVEKRKEIING